MALQGRPIIPQAIKNELTGITTEINKKASVEFNPILDEGKILKAGKDVDNNPTLVASGITEADTAITISKNTTINGNFTVTGTTTTVNTTEVAMKDINLDKGLDENGGAVKSTADIEADGGIGDTIHTTDSGILRPITYLPVAEKTNILGNLNLEENKEYYINNIKLSEIVETVKNKTLDESNSVYAEALVNSFDTKYFTKTTNADKSFEVITQKYTAPTVVSCPTSTFPYDIDLSVDFNEYGYEFQGLDVGNIIIRFFNCNSVIGKAVNVVLNNRNNNNSATISIHPTDITSMAINLAPYGEALLQAYVISAQGSETFHLREELV